jgi:hypothetical protein
VSDVLFLPPDETNRLLFDSVGHLQPYFCIYVGWGEECV